MEAGSPRQIGRYRVLRELGKGSMGVVFEAHDPALDRTIALKTINLGFALAADARREFEERFFREARISAQLSHHGIVAVHDAGRDPESGLLYIALELLEGSTLAQIKLPLDWREALRLMRGVAEALDYAHGCKVVHRDIKPANIMRLPNGATKLMDFGIARLETARGELSADGQFFGTPLYMAPELALGRRGDARADLFSLGSVCYALLTGRQAFAADNIPAIVTRIAHDDPAPPSSVVAGIPAAVDEILGRVLAKDPERRHPSARAFAEDLEDALAGRCPRHGADSRANPFPTAAVEPLPEHTLKLDLERLLTNPPRVAPLPATSAATLAAGTPSARGGSRWRAPALGAVLAVGALPLLLPRFDDWMPVPALRVAATSAPAAPALDRTGVADNQTRLPDTGAEALVAPGANAASIDPAPGLVSPPRMPSAWLLVDFSHPVESARLRVWVSGKLKLDQRQRGAVEKKLGVIKVREGEMEQTLELPPGRHEIKVAVGWDDNEKRESISGTFQEGQARHLEIRLGRLRKDLSLDWR